jgi:hypothetical protein
VPKALLNWLGSAAHDDGTEDDDPHENYDWEHNAHGDDA